MRAGENAKVNRSSRTKHNAVPQPRGQGQALRQGAARFLLKGTAKAHSEGLVHEMSDGGGPSLACFPLAGFALTMASTGRATTRFSGFLVCLAYGAPDDAGAGGAAGKLQLGIPAEGNERLDG